MLEGEIELDESQLYQKKKSEAPGRPYVYDTIWLIGFRERHSQKFLIYPTVRRTEEVFIPLLLKHVKVKSLIYSDNFSTYVNNRVFPPESKLTQWGYRHKFVNHKIEFVNGIFKEIHTNTVERLWRTVKEHIRRHKTKSLYLLCIGRFYFHRTLCKKGQLKYLVQSLMSNNDIKNEELDFFILSSNNFIK